MTIEELAVTSIVNKMRWLSTVLRRTDNPVGINDWVRSMTALNCLLQTLRTQTTSPIRRSSERRHDQIKSSERKIYTISSPCNESIYDQPSMEIEKEGDEREMRCPSQMKLRDDKVSTRTSFKRR